MEPVPSVITPPWLDKGLWVAVLGVIFGYVNTKLDINLSAEEIVGLLLPLVAYIVSHKWAATKKALAVYAAQQGLTASTQGKPTGLNQ